MDCRFSSEQDEKLVYAVRATRGHRFCGVLTTQGGRGLLILGNLLFKSHDNGFRCCEAEKGHGFRFQEIESMHDERGGGGGGGGGCPWTAHGLMWDC